MFWVHVCLSCLLFPHLMFAESLLYTSLDYKHDYALFNGNRSSQISLEQGKNIRHCLPCINCSDFEGISFYYLFWLKILGLQEGKSFVHNRMQKRINIVKNSRFKKNTYISTSKWQLFFSLKYRFFHFYSFLFFPKRRATTFFLNVEIFINVLSLSLFKIISQNVFFIFKIFSSHHFVTFSHLFSTF